MKKLNVNFVGFMQQAAPITISIVMFLTFLLIFIITYYYYYEFAFSSLLKADAVAISVSLLTAAALQLGRLAFGVASAAEFSEKDYLGGALGLMLSIALAWYGLVEIIHLAEFYESSLAGSNIALKELLSCIVVLGLALELRLILTVTNFKFNHKKSSNHGQ